MLDDDEPDAHYTVELFTGRVGEALATSIASWTLRGHTVADRTPLLGTVTTNLPGRYFYLRITQTSPAGIDRAWTAPVWFDAAPVVESPHRLDAAAPARETRAMDPRRLQDRGPFRADQLRAGDPYELSHGHPILWAPTGADGGRGTAAGTLALDTDPDVDGVGNDVGFSPEAGLLRAPNIAVGNVPDRPGWVKGVPPLAVEYACTGRDEGELKLKIEELLAAGTRWIWVVRLVGPRRVEVHTADADMRLVGPGESLTAPGVLRNPVPVEALYDRTAAQAAALRNLLEREGYHGLDNVRAEGRDEGALLTLRQSIVQVLGARGVALRPADQAVLDACADPARLTALLVRASTANRATDVFA